MQQDLDVFALLTRPGTYMLGVFVYVVVLFIRRVVESINPSLKKQADANSPKITYLNNYARWWNEVVLYALPAFIGGGSAISQSEFFFAGIGDRGGKVVFGVVVGWFSGFLYKLLKKIIQQKAGVDLSPGDSVSPPGGA